MVGDGAGAGGRGWSQPDCEGPQKPCEGLWPWGAIGIQDKQDMIRFVSQRDHSGNCEGLLEWREAGSREAVWEAFAKILVRNDDSVKAVGSFFNSSWFPKVVENQRTLPKTILIFTSTLSSTHRKSQYDALMLNL